MAAATTRWPRDALLAALARLGVPAGPINSVADALADPQLVPRGLVAALPRDGAPPVPGLRLPVRFSRSPLAPPRASPQLGKE